MTPAAPLHSGFVRSVERFPDRPALEVDGEPITYARLHARAQAIASALTSLAPGEGPPLTAVFASRSVTAFAGVLGTLYRGHGYVPLNPGFPVERTRAMLLRAGCRAIVVDRRAAPQLDELLVGCEDSLLILLPEHEDVSEEAARWPAHVVLGARELSADEEFAPTAVVEPGQIAYLLFTSGSTGVPKGVMVAHENVRHFVDTTVERYGIEETDRVSQTFDLTFDLSVFDMFVTWERGACLCCLPATALMKPGRFIDSAALTVWFSVPSVGLLMKRLGLLKAGRYPTLRWALFCGEPLPALVADAFATAAPAATVENLYGPTELTIACTTYRWDPETSPDACLHGIVPIGEPNPGMSAFVADEQLREVAPGEHGELLLTGPQVTLGYLEDPEKTARAFVRPPGREEIHYRTGDVVQRPLDDGPLVYVGRVDNQVKISGYRVELGEVEARLRAAAEVEEAVAIPWPRNESSASALTCFVRAATVDVQVVRARMAETLPSYMVPRTIHALPELPLNVNGKVDRPALVALLESRR